MVTSQRRLLIGVLLVTGAFLPLDLVFQVPQTPGLVASRALLFLGFGAVVLLLPRMTAGARTAAMTGLGVVSPIAVTLMCWGTGGTTSPAFSFMWALPMLVGMVCLEEPTADLAATLLTAICGTALLLSEGKGGPPLLYFLMVTTSGGVLATFSTWTRRRNHRAELERVRENEALLRGLVEAMPAAVLVADAAGTPRYSNALAGELTGAGAGTFLAGTDQPYPEERSCMNRALQGQRSQVDDVEITGPSGRRSIEVRGAPRFGPDGRVSHGIVILLDITERRRAEVALRAAQERLAQADRISSLGTLAAGVAHEINNPLAFIATNVALVSERLAGRSEPEVVELREALQEAEQGVVRVRDVVRNLKVFSNAHEEEVERVDVGRCLEAALTLAGNELRHRAQLVRELGEVREVVGNSARLIQVFVSLLTNAAQAIEEGRVDANTVTVRTRATAEGKVAVEVSDTGHGISPSVLPRIFEPFFTTRPQGVGAGLGLSICHGIVQKLGGAIEVETVEGRGSTFRVLLQAAAPQPAAAPVVHATAGQPTGQREIIAVIDDDALVGKSLKRLLERSYEVRSFLAAREALAWLKTDDRCDAVICDLMMPSMGGPEFHAELKKVRPALAQRVIFATGGAFSERTRQFLASADFCVEKPFVGDSLLSTVRRALQAG